MAFSDDSVKAKLSALNETQDSIVSVAQWIMFYRRHADRAAQIWLEKLKESNTSKKLNLIYLANEIMQQAKVRRKEDFLVAFMPIISEATAAAYKGAPREVQIKIRRVVEVWRSRQILSSGVQDATEARIDELDKNKSTGSTGARLGGSLFGSSSVPTELQPLVQTHGTLAKAETSAKPLVEKANNDYAEQNKPDAPVPSAPVQAGRLSSLMKSLATAEAAVSDSINARKQLVAGLEKLLHTHNSKLAEEETTKTQLTQRRTESETKRKEVEDVIFRRVSAEDAANGTADGAQAGQSDDTSAPGPDMSPEVEAFTPPPPDVEEFTPPPTDNGRDALEVGTYAADPVQELPPKEEQPPAFEPPPVLQTESSNGQNGLTPVTQYPAPGADLLSSLSLPGVARPSSAVNGGTSDPRKRRKMSHKEPDLDEQMFGSGDGIGLDEDIAASLGAK
ncbi:RNA polymerase II-binding domain-containing protein 1 [Elsinoe australis]|uniref:RNA polymerase II-binding domain-containing protein 1 n=1 Tax=Elsinoe australis TaxID=40998 RepID=A0A4U7B6T5_9PEZI|nr:RNA polymerase II-binding domain-containing protein 1 [Elsinoe australis]